MSGGLFEKFAPLRGALQGLIGNGASPFGVPVERVLSPTEAIIGGRPTILAGTFNYLGLTFDPDCIEAAKNALDRDGTGTTGSRISSRTRHARCCVPCRCGLRRMACRSGTGPSCASSGRRTGSPSAS